MSILQIDDLEPAYTRYVNAYQIDFDSYPPVQSNSDLLPILKALPPLSSEPQSTHPTVDALFRLPLLRLEYYKRLYAKLLKSTQPGKGDHHLLLNANEKLDWLLSIGSESAQRSVNQNGDVAGPNSSSARPKSGDDKTRLGSFVDVNARKSSESASISGSSSVERSSGRTTTSQASTAPSSDQSILPLSPANMLLDLENRLDTSRTLDIFTMTYKVRQSINLNISLSHVQSLIKCQYSIEMQASDESS